MRTLFFLFLALLFNNAFSQKLVKKELINPESKTFLIDADKCFKVDLQTHQSNSILINATIDGEYRKDLLVSIQEEGSNVTISTDFQPNFENPNDKLSAHKVLSIYMKITLPEFVDTHIFGTNANVTVSGNYKKLKVDLADGNCTLNKVGQKAEVRTQSGTIFLNAPSGIVNSESQYGRVFEKQIPHGNNFYKLGSVEGDIHISKTE